MGVAHAGGGDGEVGGAAGDGGGAEAGAVLDRSGVGAPAGDGVAGLDAADVQGRAYGRGEKGAATVGFGHERALVENARGRGGGGPSGGDGEEGGEATHERSS
jgi:hypothetical protein